MPKVKTDAEWAAEGDANVLAQAKEIQGDSKRMSAAKKAGDRLVKEHEERLKALKSALEKDDEAKGE